MTELYEIRIYQTNSGKEPYTEWEKKLDKITMARIDTSLLEYVKLEISVIANRLEMGFMS